MPKIHRIKLTEEERRHLRGIADAARGSKERRRRANILLMSDESDGGPGMSDKQVADALGCRANSVARIRKACFERGVEGAVERRPTSRVQERKLDGRAEARLLEIACGPAPEGQARWSLRLLSDRLVELEVVDSVSHTTVGNALKKTSSGRTS